MRIAGVVLSVAALACRSTPDNTIRLSDYSTTCEASADCVPISLGNLCPCPPCPNAAISKSDEQRYESDFQSRSQCDLSGESVACTPCPSTPPATCVMGECSLVSPIRDGGDEQ